MLELLLRVDREDGSTTDVKAEVADEHTVVDLANAIAVHLGMSVPSGHDPKLGCHRLGTQLSSDQRVLDSGLMSGDLVHLGLRFAEVSLDADHGGGGLFCDVISGPSSGSSVLLRAGRLTIGRDAGCDLTLEDPTVSKQHAVLLIDSAGGVEVAPAPEVTNAVVVDGQVIAEAVPLALGSVLQLGACALVVRHYAPAVGASRDQLGQIPFNRTPYKHPDLSPVEVRGAGRPPGAFEPRPVQLMAMLLPLIGGVVFAVWLGRPEFLLFVALGPLSMVSSWWSDRRRGGATHRQQIATFERRYDEWLVRYDQALADERHRRAAAAPDIAELARRAGLRTADLWPRSRRTEGFLHLRLGLGEAPALATSKLPDDVEADPDHRIESAIQLRRELPSVPITVDLVERGVLAVHGAPREVETSVASLLFESAVLHSPDDLVVCGYLDPRRTLRDWVKWMPHTRSVASPLEGRHLAVGVGDAEDLLRRVLAVISQRSGEKDPWPRVLLFLDELVEADALLVSSVLEAGPAAGVFGVWIGQDAAHVPRQATAILECPAVSSGRRAAFWTTDPTVPTMELDPDRLGLEAAPRLARALAPVRDASSASAAASIPRIAPLLESLGSATMDADEIVARWSRPVSYGLVAPIGIGPAGPMLIDLVEHGPHALIAGTSGAGKSELLQSAIASLIANYPPTRLNLLFIDYKGGASSNLFQPVPHTVGYVTNLGADLAMRALISLRAELDRRMRLLEGRAPDLGKMLEDFPDEAPPSLVIVVDEFATLVKEIPDFVAGMVDVAQRGRSLGIHLILATQRPAGAVNDNILANTNLRISLRVLDPGDSSSILGSGEAASIPGPLRGRGFARLGAGGLIEFQSAYSGAPFTASGGVTPVVVTDFPATDRVTVHPAPESSGGAAVAERTHLDVVLSSVLEATDRLGLERGRRPWLEDLPRHIDLGDVLAGDYGPVGELVPGRDVVLGVLDEPEQQVQRPATIDLEASGGLLIFGTGGSGRTTTLRTLLASAFSVASPARVEAHVLDFSGRALDPLRGLPHVAAVATGDDLEQATRMLMHLRAEVGRRQTLLAEHRAENLTAYNQQRPEQALPRLLLALDGYEGFDRTFERGDLYLWGELLIETVLAGRAVGLHLLATTDRRISVPAGLANSISGRLILRTADVDGLIDLGVPPAVARDARLGDGRAFVAGGATVQIAVVGDDVSNAGQTAALEERSHASAAGLQVELPCLPEVLTVAQVPVAPPRGPMSFTLGVADLTQAPVVCDVRLQNLTVIGPGESGRSTALRTAARALRDDGCDVWVIADPSGPLSRDTWDHHATRRDQQRPLIDELAQVAQRGGPPPVLVIDAIEQVGDDVGMALEPLLRDDLVRVLAGADGTTLGGYVAGWANLLKGTRRMLLLQPDELGDTGSLTPIRLRLRPGQPFPPGRGVFIDGRHWALVQVAQAESEPQIDTEVATIVDPGPSVVGA